MNTYKHRFTMRCPNNDAVIFYQLEIRTFRMIQVEKIVLACEMWLEGYHENMAGNLYYQFGGCQILRAHHHGVDVVTYRGPLWWRLFNRIFAA